VNMKKEWYEKSTPRSVDALQLWMDNPRLDPDAETSSLKEYVVAITQEEGDKKSFYELLRSIAQKFVPLDPIVVWKTEAGKFCVAEGNRRVLALKLLANPDSAPRSIKSMVRGLSTKMPSRIDKIPVYVAPSFEDAIWYINQRNNSSSMRRSWSRLQQFRWIQSLYETYGDDLVLLMEYTNMTESELEGVVRILKLINLIRTKPIKSVLTTEEYARAISHKFPVTIIERIFANVEVREKWGVSFDGININLQNRSGFLKVYAELIKSIVSEDADRVNTRINTKEIKELLTKLPQVDLGVDDEGRIDEEGKEEDAESKALKPHRHRKKSIAGDPNRNNIIANNYVLKSDNPRLFGIFNELKRLSPNVYVNAAAASLRIFLDVAVLNYIQSEALEEEICRKYSRSLRDVELKKRLEFLKEKFGTRESAKVIARLVNESNDYSLDVLNGYQHGKKMIYLTKHFINGFWDVMLPLFKELLDISEVE